MDEPALRLATLADEGAIRSLMRASIARYFPDFYSAAQTASSVEHVAVPDRTLIEDGTYFVLEAGGDLVACGGWSRRDKLYTGSGDAEGDIRVLDPATEPARVRAMFVHPDWGRRGLGRRILEACEAAARAEGYRRLALRATLPGEKLYEVYGFRKTERMDVTMPDGMVIEANAMEMPLD